MINLTIKLNYFVHLSALNPLISVVLLNKKKEIYPMLPANTLQIIKTSRATSRAMLGNICIYVQDF